MLSNLSAICLIIYDWLGAIVSNCLLDSIIMPLLWGSHERSLTSPILPIDSPSSRESRRPSSTFFCCRTALFVILATTILTTIFLTCVGSLPVGALLSVLPYSRTRPPPDLLVDSSASLPPAPSAPPTQPKLKQYDGYLELEELRTLVSKTKGYFARDYSLHLGWNNVRIYT